VGDGLVWSIGGSFVDGCFVDGSSGSLVNGSSRSLVGGCSGSLVNRSLVDGGSSGVNWCGVHRSSVGGRGVFRLLVSGSGVSGSGVSGSGVSGCCVLGLLVGRGGIGGRELDTAGLAGFVGFVGFRRSSLKLWPFNNQLQFRIKNTESSRKFNSYVFLSGVFGIGVRRGRCRVFRCGVRRGRCRVFGCGVRRGRCRVDRCGVSCGVDRL
jgi:hypothetical protein